MLIICFLFLTGCATTRTVELDLSNSTAPVQIQAGDYIEITTRNGDKHQIKVSSVTESIIESEEESFNIEEIEKIGKSELTPGGAVAAAGAGVAFGAALSAITAAFMMAILF